MTESILRETRSRLEAAADAALQISEQRFFKEEIKLYGIKSSQVNKISRAALPQIGKLTKKEVFTLCEELLASDYAEEAYIACAWIYSRRQEYQPEDFLIFEHWVSQYVNNWAKCDTLCNHSLAALIDLYPQYLSNLKEWARSSHRWTKRASAVTLIIPARQGRYLEDIFEIAGILLPDKDDMVQKGYGWMLKAASESHQAEVFDYVMRHRSEMPRTALRYAIEKMPPELRKQAMAR